MRPLWQDQHAVLAKRTDREAVSLQCMWSEVSWEAIGVPTSCPVGGEGGIFQIMHGGVHERCRTSHRWLVKHDLQGYMPAIAKQQSRAAGGDLQEEDTPIRARKPAAMLGKRKAQRAE